MTTANETLTALYEKHYLKPEETYLEDYLELMNLAREFATRLDERGEAAQIPPGWKLVPIELTKEMLVAGETALSNCKDSGYDSGGDGESYHSYEYILPGAEKAVWDAMLNAAPACGTSAQNINQCDGCQRGLPLRKSRVAPSDKANLHYDPATGLVVMACTKDRYEP